jgi:hypothetical protein
MARISMGFVDYDSEPSKSVSIEIEGDGSRLHFMECFYTFLIGAGHDADIADEAIDFVIGQIEDEALR